MMKTWRQPNFTFPLFALALFWQSTYLQAQSGEFQFDNRQNSGHWLYTVDTSWNPTDDIDPVAGFQPVSYSEFSINRKIGTSKIHFSNAAQENERLNQLGFSYKNINLEAFSGHGQTVSGIRSRFDSMDSYQFHGGIDQRFDYNGFGVGRNIGQNASIRYNWARITADDVEDRVVHAIGASVKNTELALMTVSRGGDRVGAAASLSTVLRNQFISYDYMKQDNGASYQGISYKTNHNGINYQLQFQKTKNPLYLEKNDNRLLFSVKFKTRNRFSPLSAAEAESNKANKGFIIAGGIVGAGVILSSGSSHADESFRFAGQHDAAFDVLNRINPVSVRENLEYGGYIYRNVDGSYSSTTPIRGNRASITLPHSSSIIPGNTVARAWYHTHGELDPRYDTENFSPLDINSSRRVNLDAYLGTPGGLLRYFDVDRLQISTLGRIAI